VIIDKRDKRGGEKNWEWIKKGIPLRIEVGPRDIEAKAMMVSRRDRPHKDKTKINLDEIGHVAVEILEEIQNNYFVQAKQYRDASMCSSLKTFEDLKRFFSSENDTEASGGFVLAKWCGDVETEKMLEELKISIRCLPLVQSGTQGICILTGRPATQDVILAKSY
jgi:prolyl-tRNA synthetase